MKRTKYWKIIYFLPLILNTNTKVIVGDGLEYVNDSIVYNQELKLFLTKEEIITIQDAYKTSALFSSSSWYLIDKWLDNKKDRRS